MKLLLVAGARPNFMKIAPIMRAIKAHPEHHITCTLVHTGQHYDQSMSQTFFDGLGIPAPDYNLEVGSGTHAVQTDAITDVFFTTEKEGTDSLLVEGHPKESIHFVGHVMIDNLFHQLLKQDGRPPSDLADRVRKMLPEGSAECARKKVVSSYDIHRQYPHRTDPRSGAVWCTEGTSLRFRCARRGNTPQRHRRETDHDRGMAKSRQLAVDLIGKIDGPAAETRKKANDENRYT